MGGIVSIARGLRFAVAISVALVVSALPAAPLETELAGRAAAQADAALRVVHAVSDAGPIDVYIDGRLAVVGAAFPSVTDALAVPAGDRRVTVSPSGAGPDSPIVDTLLTVEPGALEEVAVVGAVASAQAVAFVVDEEPLDNDRARLRVVHVGPDAGAVGVGFAGGDLIFPPVEFLAATEYAEAPAGAYGLDVLSDIDGTLLATLPELALAPGDVADVYLVGQIADATFQPLVVRSSVPVTARVGRAATLRAGTCEAPGTVVAEIGLVASPRGDEVGQGDAAGVDNGFGTVAVSFEQVVAAPHVVAVAAPEIAPDPLVACGAVAGALTDDGSLVVGLASSGRESVGIAVIAPGVLDPTTTDVSVFLLSAADADPTTGATATPETADPASASSQSASGAIRTAVSAATPTSDG